MFGFFLLFSSLQQFALAGAPQPVDLMITAGDSISTGYLSEWRASRRPESTSSSNPGFIDSDPPSSHPRHTVPYWLLRLAQLRNSKYTLSWSSGQNIESHHVRLKKILAQTEPEVYLETYNVGMAGSFSFDLPGQARQAVAAWKTGRYRKIKYITVTIGANDACAPWFPDGTPDSEIESSIREFFSILTEIKQDEPIRVLFSSIPNIPSLGRPEILNHPLTRKMNCEYRMKVRDHYCNALVDWKTPDEYQQRLAIIIQKNNVIRRVLSEIASSMKKNYEVAFSESLFFREIKIEYLSKDCYHPNADGQQEISDELWKDQPWFK